MAKSALLILNRKSAARPDVRDAVKARPERLEVVIPWNRKALRNAVVQALDNGVPRIIAGGGDGTLKKVAEGIVRSGNTDVAMGLIPLGTANDFARSYGDDGSDVGSSLSRALTLQPTPIDVGQINGKVFVNVASGGFGAMITATTDRDLKRRLGGLAYSLAGLARISELTTTRARITLGEKSAHEVEMLALVIGNNRYAGGGFDVAPEADLTDGALDLGVLTRDGLFPSADQMRRLLDPEDDGSTLVDRARFASGVIETESPFHINLDGEPMVDTRFEIGIMPKALNFVLP